MEPQSYKVSIGAVMMLGIAAFFLAAGLTGDKTTQSESGTEVLNAKIDRVATEVADLSSTVEQLAAVSGAAVKNEKRPDTDLANTLLIRFKPGVSEAAMANIFKNSGVTVVDEIGQINVKVIKVPAQARDQVKEALSHNPRVEFVEVNELLEPSFVPNDPEYPNQWHHGVIGSPLAWDIASNTPIIVAVADTGVTVGHADLAGSLLPGFNTVDDTTDVTDVNGHGTAVAGTLAAIGNNANQVAGVAYGAKIIPLKISNASEGYAYYSDMAQAITYAADHGAKVVNLSYLACGGAAVRSAGAYMKSKGGLTFVAAGNENSDPGWTDSPDIICVSATVSSDGRASYSNFGSFVDIASPGSGIRTTTKSGGTGSWNGTSFASPVAAGVAALMWMSNPTLEPDVVEQVLKDTAKDLGTAGWDQYYGWGRVDAGAAVRLAATLEGPAPDTSAPTVAFGQPQEGAEVSGVTTVTVNATDNVEVSRVELKVNGALYATDTNAPYQFSVDTNALDNGTVALEAVAYDTSNNVASANRNINVLNVPDTIAPEVAVTSPADGAEVSPKKAFGISVTASDNVGVTEIDILFDGVVRATCSNSSSCSASINARKEAQGTHTITAVAYDAAGNVAVVDSEVHLGTSSGSTDDGSTDGGSTKPVKCSPWPSCR